MRILKGKLSISLNYLVQLFQVLAHTESTEANLSSTLFFGFSPSQQDKSS